MYFRGVPRWLSGTRPFAKWLVESFLLLLVTDSIANCFSFRLIDPKRWKPAAYVRRVVSGYLGVYGNEIPFLWFLRARAMLLKYRWADFETVHMNRIIVRVEIFKYAVEFVSCIRLHRLTTQSSVTMFRSNRLEFSQVVPILSSILSPSRRTLPQFAEFHWWINLSLLGSSHVFKPFSRVFRFSAWMCLHWKSDEGLWLMWFENIRVFMHDNQ